MFKNDQQPRNVKVRKELQKSPMVWPKITSEFQHEGRSFSIRPMDAPDIDAIVGLYREHCPYFYQSSNQILLEPQFYQQQVCHLSQWSAHASERLYFFGLIEEVTTHQIVMAFGCRKDAYDRVIQNLAVILDPDHRGNQLAGHYVSYLDQLWTQSGTDYVYGHMSLQDIASQKAFLKIGAQFGGILPGITRRTPDGQTYFRDSQAYMYKFYNQSEKYCTPLQDSQLAPQAISDLEKMIHQLKKYS